MLAPVLALALVCTLSLPASAFFWNKKTDVPSVSDFSKNGMVGQVISFSAEDFPVSGGSGGTALAAITLKTLPRYRRRDAHRRRTAPDRGRPGWTPPP